MKTKEIVPLTQLYAIGAPNSTWRDPRCGIVLDFGWTMPVSTYSRSQPYQNPRGSGRHIRVLLLKDPSGTDLGNLMRNQGYYRGGVQEANLEYVPAQQILSSWADHVEANSRKAEYRQEQSDYETIISTRERAQVARAKSLLKAFGIGDGPRSADYIGDGKDVQHGGVSLYEDKQLNLSASDAQALANVLEAVLDVLRREVA